MSMRNLMRRLWLACIVAFVSVAVVNAGAESSSAQDVTLGPVTGLPMPRFVSLRSDTANARRGPGLDYQIDWEYLRRGLPVEVTAEYGNWRRVRDSDGMGGWVHQTLLSGVRTALVRGTKTVPLRAGAEPSDRVRAMVEPGVIVRMRECDGAMCRVSADGTDGWISQAVLWGVAPDEIID